MPQQMLRMKMTPEVKELYKGLRQVIFDQKPSKLAAQAAFVYMLHTMVIDHEDWQEQKRITAMSFGELFGHIMDNAGCSRDRFVVDLDLAESKKPE